jgi:hypothetical protein
MSRDTCDCLTCSGGGPPDPPPECEVDCHCADCHDAACGQDCERAFDDCRNCRESDGREYEEDRDEDD